MMNRIGEGGGVVFKVKVKLLGRHFSIFGFPFYLLPYT